MVIVAKLISYMGVCSGFLCENRKLAALFKATSGVLLHRGSVQAKTKKCRKNPL